MILSFHIQLQVLNNELLELTFIFEFIITLLIEFLAFKVE